MDSQDIQRHKAFQEFVQTLYPHCTVNQRDHYNIVHKTAWEMSGHAEESACNAAADFIQHWYGEGLEHIISPNDPDMLANKIIGCTWAVFLRYKHETLLKGKVPAC